ncbi:MAG TPA: Re/Si-specific NAD(P)(+) transhydrogenase subunit alpha [Acidimicrobiales bacterium]|nr:Re/Si-specific NAD(P)(+) transhydrogenase subunit alpha [Acidimicrobiales bacterium]
MQLTILKERAPFERRSAMVPDVADRLVRQSHHISVESGVGAEANFSDDAYRAHEVSVSGNVRELLEGTDVLCCVSAPPQELLAYLRPGSALVGLLQPSTNLETVEFLLRQEITSLSLDLLPRISRAQSMDALSSQATVSGYRAVLIGASRLGKFLPMFMTAAGTIPPAKVLVLGAGVAGLQAIATARRLGAVVRANDVRASSKDEVQSLGATFVELPLETQEGTGGYAREQSEDFLNRQREMIAREVAMADIVISTAAIPGRTAPRLVTTEMVEAMAPGSVIVDLAAESGGNCELSRPGEEVIHRGVIVHGVRNLPSSMPTHASFLYARNIAEFVGLLSKDGKLELDFDDEIVAGSCITYAGEIRHEPTANLLKEQRS